jgi:hypothetical protein
VRAGLERRGVASPSTWAWNLGAAARHPRLVPPLSLSPPVAPQQATPAMPTTTPVPRRRSLVETARLGTEDRAWNGVVQPKAEPERWKFAYDVVKAGSARSPQPCRMANPRRMPAARSSLSRRGNRAAAWLRQRAGAGAAVRPHRTTLRPEMRRPWPCETSSTQPPSTPFPPLAFKDAMRPEQTFRMNSRRKERSGLHPREPVKSQSYCTVR